MSCPFHLNLNALVPPQNQINQDKYESVVSEIESTPKSNIYLQEYQQLIASNPDPEDNLKQIKVQVQSQNSFKFGLKKNQNNFSHPKFEEPATAYHRTPGRSKIFPLLLKIILYLCLHRD